VADITTETVAKEDFDFGPDRQIAVIGSVELGAVAEAAFVAH